MFISPFISQRFNQLIEKEYNNAKKVIMIHPLTLMIIKIWNNTIEAGLLMRINNKNIHSACVGNYNQCGGYYWRYLDEYIKELNGNYYIKCYPEYPNDIFNTRFKCDIFDFLVYNNMSNYIQPCFNYQYGEIWKDVIGYEGLYKISNWGRVMSIRKYPYIYEMKFYLDKDGYCIICLTDNQLNEKKYKIHRLVAIAFIPNPNNLPCINHKDENKTNNHVSNLEWCTIEYNNNYNNRYNRIKINKIGKLNGIK